MARFKSLLLRVDVRPAGRRCNCAHNPKHEPRFVVKAPGIATPEKGYCAACGLAMIKSAEDELQALQSRVAI
jgi:hypothetical protein